MSKSLVFLTLTFVLSLAFPACAQSQPATASDPLPSPFSPVIVSGETIYLAGHLGFDPETDELPAGGIGPQTTQTLTNIGTTLASVGATHADLVRCQVFLADIADFGAMNIAYRAFFPDTPPARTTVAVAGLAANALIEIECTGVKGHGSS